MGCGNSVVSATEPSDTVALVKKEKQPDAKAAASHPIEDKNGRVWTLEDVLRETDLSSKQTIDEQMALDQVNGDVELLQDLNGMMCDQFKQDFGDIQRCHKEQNWFKLWKSAHSLKGATANLGINKFAEVCRLLEHIGKEMDNLATTGQVVPPGHVQKVGIYIHLLSSEWEEYRRCYEAFEKRLLDQQK
eukprot:EG_transcript_23627